MQVFCCNKIFNGAWYFDLNEILNSYPVSAVGLSEKEIMQNGTPVFVLIIRIN